MTLPTFFGVEVIPNHIYKANIQHELIITRATISPDAKDNQNARLFVNIEKEEGPVCHLDCNLTTVPLCIRIASNAQLILRVAGDCSIHVTGYISPDSKERDLLRKMMSDSDDYYYEEEEEEEKGENENQSNTEKTEENEETKEETKEETNEN